MADITPNSSPGLNPTPEPTPGRPGIGFEGAMPNLHPTSVEDTMPQVVEIDWPPVQQHTPDDPADTPGWNDDQSPAAYHQGQPEHDDTDEL